MLGNACTVTILILIDGFLQLCMIYLFEYYEVSHNPYFNRWFSAIQIFLLKNVLLLMVTILILIDGFLQYHHHHRKTRRIYVTILILIDGFLQFVKASLKQIGGEVTILILIDGFLQLLKNV